MEKDSKNKSKLLSTVAKIAFNIGKDSVGLCYAWFNQPKVPEKLKEMKND